MAKNKGCGCFPLLILLGAAGYGGYYWYDKCQQEDAAAALAAEKERIQAARAETTRQNELNAARSAVDAAAEQQRAAEARIKQAEERAKAAEEAARLAQEKMQQLQEEARQEIEAAKRAAEEATNKAKEKLASLAKSALKTESTSAPEADEEETDDEPEPLITASQIRNYVQCRADGNYYGISSMFAGTVQYKYADFRNVSRDTVLEDIQAGWNRWIYRTYTLEAAGINGNKVELIYYYQLKEANGRKSAKGYTKEIWNLNSDGKIYYWDEELSKKSAPKLSPGMTRLF